MATSWVTVAADAVHVETGAAYAPAIGLDLQNVRDVVGLSISVLYVSVKSVIGFATPCS